MSDRELEAVAEAIDWIERAILADYTDGDEEGFAALNTALDSLRASRQPVSGGSEEDVEALVAAWLFGRYAAYGAVWRLAPDPVRQAWLSDAQQVVRLAALSRVPADGEDT